MRAEGAFGKTVVAPAPGATRGVCDLWLVAGFLGIVYETSCQRADAGDGVAERRLLDRVSQRSRGPPKPSHAQAFPPGTDCSLVTQS